MHEAILNDHENNTHIWTQHIKNDPRPEADFLFLILPFMEQAYTALKKIKFKKITITDANLSKIIFQDFNRFWLHKLLRSCVLELHDAKHLQQLQGETPELRFRHFVSYLTDSVMQQRFYEKYPVLAKKITPFVEKHIQFFSLLLKRLDTDFVEIEKNLYLDAHIHHIDNIEKAGDLHGHGNSVSIITLTNKSQQARSKIVYKPRVINTDIAYYQFLSWLNQFSVLPLRCMKLLAKNNYGWCEYIEKLPCNTAQELSNYYYRLGALLAVTYLLQGADIHYENIIVNGEYPMIVDLECFGIPRLDFSSEHAKINPHASRHSVLHISILPERRLFGPGSSGIDMSAFNFSAGQKAPNLSLAVENSGTDEMRVLRKEIYTSHATNIPKSDEQDIEPLDYEQNFVSGFTHLYQIFCDHKKTLLSKDSPLTGFLSATSRIVFRPTMEYMTLLNESYHPSLLHDEESYLQHFERLKQMELLQPIVASETKQLLEDDIPAYYCDTNSKRTVIDAYGMPVNIKITQSGYQKIQAHLTNNINENDLKIQLKLIEQTFVAARINQAEDNKAHSEITKTIIPSQQQIQSQAREIAKRLLDEIQSYTITDGDKLYWPQTHTQQSIWATGFTDQWLYKGLLGVALSFAYAEKIFIYSNYQTIVDQAIQNLEAELQILNQQKSLIPIGAFNGLGGIFYFCGALSKVQQNYQLKPLLNLITTHLELFMESEQPTAMGFDIIAGVAGLLKCILNCRHLFPEENFNRYIDFLAFNILNYYPDPTIIPPLFQAHSKQKRPMLGFSHGTAGIAWALFHYYNYRKSNSIKAWINKALAYERSFYSLNYQNWPNFKDMNDAQIFDERFYSSQWCHGAAGIGMARLDMFRAGWEDELIAYEINVALNSTVKQGFFDNFNLCHGAMGRIDFLLQAKQQGLLKTFEYEGFVKQILMLLNDLYFPTEKDSKLFTVGLMTGRAGVAYQLMRIANPDTVPSILLLE